MMEAVGREVPITWRGRRVRTFVPALLTNRDMTLAPVTLTTVGRALAEVERGAADLPEDYTPLARLLLRAEGIASSYIEGVAAPVVEIVLAEAGGGRPGAAAWVAANLAATTSAVEAAAEHELSVKLLCDWHRTLMAHSPIPEQQVGRLRNEQGWIGGSSPLDAHLVTPPVDELPALLDDLTAWANRTDIDPVVQAATAHAQFELIHPFADGNGRIGRILVSWVLVRRLHLVTAPPVSVRIAADVGGYVAGLTQFRFGLLDPWVRWFAEAVSGAGRAQQDLVTSVVELRETWNTRLQARAGRRLRADALAWRTLDLLPRHLVLSTTIVAGELGVPRKTARAALEVLCGADIIVEHDVAATKPGRPTRWYVAPELLGLTGSSPFRR